MATILQAVVTCIALLFIATQKGTMRVTSDLGVQGLLEDVLFCPDAPYNLLSVPKMQRAGYTIIFDQHGSQVCKGDTTVMKGTVNTLKSLHIHVPKAVLSGRNAELMCTYELEGAQLYSIRWYRNMMEFYRYVPKESPATKVFPVAEIKVDVAGSDQNRVILTEVDRTLTGEYQCEVSADAPLFHTDIKAAEMVVVEPPLTSPNVTSDRMSYVGGDHIQANCSSPPSLPAANVTWYVNEQMVPGFTANNILNFSNGYASSQATLELEAAAVSPVPTLMIRCEASIFDVWKSTSHTLVLRERSANPASALGRSFTGAAADTRLSTIMVLLLQFFLKILLGKYAETSIR